MPNCFVRPQESASQRFVRRLIEGRRLDAVFLGWMACDGVQFDVGYLRALEDPHVAAIVLANDPTGPIAVFFRKPSLEYVRGLDPLSSGA